MHIAEPGIEGLLSVGTASAGTTAAPTPRAPVDHSTSPKSTMTRLKQTLNSDLLCSRTALLCCFVTGFAASPHARQQFIIIDSCCQTAWAGFSDQHPKTVDQSLRELHGTMRTRATNTAVVMCKVAFACACCRMRRFSLHV